MLVVAEDLVVNFGLRAMMNSTEGYTALPRGAGAAEADVALLELPTVNDRELSRLRALSHQVPVIVLVAVAQLAQALGVLGHGAKGILLKETYTPELLCAAARAAVAGHTVLDPALSPLAS